MKPCTQLKLYGYKDLFNTLIRLDNNQLLPNKIIVSGKKGIGKSTFAYHFVNYIFSKNEQHNYNLNNFEINEHNRSYTLINKSLHPNFFLIDVSENKKKIDISQIRNALDFSNKSSFNDDYRIILIDNIEYLNINSANALLKIIEEPNEKLMFILIHNSTKKILSTIKSRCIVFNKNFKTEDNIKIFENLTNEKIDQSMNKNILNQYMSVGDLYRIKKFSEENKIDLLDKNHYDFLKILFNSTHKKNENNTELIIMFIQIYFYKSLIKCFTHKIFEQQNYFYKKIHNANKYNLDLENIFLEFKTRVLNE